MLKYLYCKEVFREVPGEITLALSISNCQIKCNGCNQKELWKDIGTPLSNKHLNNLISLHDGITCVLFMGSGNKEYKELNELAKIVKERKLKVALYLGEDIIPKEINVLLFNYIKIGHWDNTKGGLDSPTSNQRFYFINHSKDGNYWVNDYTHKFLK